MEIPSLLQQSKLLVVSDGLQARIGSSTANQEWFRVWRTVDSDGDAPKSSLKLETLIRGVFEKRRFPDMQHFIVFGQDTESDRLHKIIAGYHQFHVVDAAMQETVRASGMGDAAMMVGEDEGAQLGWSDAREDSTTITRADWSA